MLLWLVAELVEVGSRGKIRHDGLLQAASVRVPGQGERQEVTLEGGVNSSCPRTRRRPHAPRPIYFCQLLRHDRTSRHGRVTTLCQAPRLFASATWVMFS